MGGGQGAGGGALGLQAWGAGGGVGEVGEEVRGGRGAGGQRQEMEKEEAWQVGLQGLREASPLTARPHSSSPPPTPCLGTYAGMVERLDYLKSLGVNAIELLPVFEFNELEYYSQIPGSDQYR